MPQNPTTEQDTKPVYGRSWPRLPLVLFMTAALLLATGLVLPLFGVDHFSALLAMSVLILLCAGLGALAIRAGKVMRRRLMQVYLVVPAIIIALSLALKYNHLSGAGLAGILGVFMYCFAYAPVALLESIAKWRPFARNNWEVFLLSSLDFLSINLILLGLLMHYQSWVDHFHVVYAGIALLLAGLFSWNARFKHEVVARKEAEDLIKQQYVQIAHEKKLADDLLLNILPVEVASELKTKGTAEPRQFDEVTVLFTDFKGFTAVAEKLSAHELVAEIHACFMAFDRIIEKYGIEKIKTIGDAYMAAGGLTRTNTIPAVDVVNAALDIRDFIATRCAQHEAEGKPCFQIRIGIHTGPLVAGIVGIKKFAYDIWGDTVNTASRMESSGEAGKVNISGVTYRLVVGSQLSVVSHTALHTPDIGSRSTDNQLLTTTPAFAFTPRGMIEAKGKGEMEMYFVERA